MITPLMPLLSALLWPVSMNAEMSGTSGRSVVASWRTSGMSASAHPGEELPTCLADFGTVRSVPGQDKLGAQTQQWRMPLAT